MNQIFLSSGPVTTALFAAAIDGGHLDEGAGRRVLLVCDETDVPEPAPPPEERVGHAALFGRFDEVISLNEVIAPMHPRDWQPVPEEQPMLERLLRYRWGLGTEPVELVVENLESAPARTVAEIFHDAAVTVCCAGPEVYGPVRALLPRGVGGRTGRVLYLDLLPGLPPRLLADYGASHQVIAQDVFTKAFDEIAAGAEALPGDRPPVGADGTALIIGRRLTDLEFTAEQEERIHAEMLRGLVARGHRTVVLVPDPNGQAGVAARLAAEAGRLGADLPILDDPVPAEVWCAVLRPVMTVGLFSPALVRASRILDVPTATLGMLRVLERLVPYDHADRISATIVDATFPRLTDEGAIVPPPIASDETESRLAPLLAAVTYCMQPGRHPEMRGATADYLDALAPGSGLRRYFRTQRLIGLGLAQVQAPQPPAPEGGGTLQRVTRRLKGRNR